jgi:hypothetical protein
VLSAVALVRRSAKKLVAGQGAQPSVPAWVVVLARH